VTLLFVSPGWVESPTPSGIDPWVRWPVLWRMPVWGPKYRGAWDKYEGDVVLILILDKLEEAIYEYRRSGGLTPGGKARSDFWSRVLDTLDGLFDDFDLHGGSGLTSSLERPGGTASTGFTGYGWTEVTGTSSGSAAGADSASTSDADASTSGSTGEAVADVEQARATDEDCGADWGGSGAVWTCKEPSGDDGPGEGGADDAGTGWAASDDPMSAVFAVERRMLAASAFATIRRGHPGTSDDSSMAGANASGDAGGVGGFTRPDDPAIDWGDDGPIRGGISVEAAAATVEWARGRGRSDPSGGGPSAAAATSPLKDSTPR
jgi:hypothetical protein